MVGARTGQKLLDADPIYHITHINNLPGIIAAGELWCDAVRTAKAAKGANVVGIAHQHIKDRRARRIVRKAAGGTLADYVPFYFAPRSPMLYTISRGNVVGYNAGQEQIVHLVSTVEIACDLNKPWFFTDGHADMAISKQFEDLTSLKEIDWPIMQDRLWHDTIQDGDRKRRRQAEFLVHQAFPWTGVAQVGVMSQEIAAPVEGALTESKHKPRVVVRADWYYEARP